MQMQLDQDDQDTYVVKSLKFCAGTDDRRLVGGTLARQCSIQMLDETWVHR